MTDYRKLEQTLREVGAAALTRLPDEPVELYRRLTCVAGLVREARAVLRAQDAAGRVAHLVFQDDTGCARAVPLAGETLVGRDPAAQVRMTDPHFSRRQFRILPTPEGPVLEDLHSRNGTRVNGRLETERRLLDGDLIEVGRQVLVFLGPIV